MKLLLELYLTFLKIGATAFGGGYAVLPLINEFIVEEKHWLTISEMTDVVSISNMTPGPIAINSATFVGAKVSGIIGSIIATLGVVTPSVIIMMFLGYLLFSTSKKFKLLDKMLIVLKPGIVGLIAVAAINMTKNSVFFSENFSFNNLNPISTITFIIGIVLYSKKFDLIKLILLGAVLGICLSFLI